jgi:6-pyruvoyltetrahydropterin/6-carboxytetrahydropterin synthase
LPQSSRLSRIEISKEAHNFSIGHFTIFSSTDREDLHGHNFQLHCNATAELNDEGLLFDYAILKKLLKNLCDEIDEQVILPLKSPHLSIDEDGDYVVAGFNDEKLYFLHRDVTLLPIANSTVEEFSHYFLGRILEHPNLKDKGVLALTVKVSSNSGQFGVAEWNLERNLEQNSEPNSEQSSERSGT